MKISISTIYKDDYHCSKAMGFPRAIIQKEQWTR